MRIISFGELCLDYYIKDDIVKYVNGGKISANIIANLSKNFDTAYFGVVGNDLQGKIAKLSLDKLNVDVSNIKEINEPTKINFFKNGEYTRICPYCNRVISTKYNRIEKEIIKKIKDDDIVIIDNLNEDTIDIVNSINNTVILDFNHLGDLLYLSLEEIHDIISGRFKIINLNVSVYNIFKEKFLLDSTDLFELFNTDLLIINKNALGVDFIYKDGFVKKELENYEIEIDKSGTKEAFFSEIIRTYIELNEISEKMISKAYIRASVLSSFVAKHLGARCHLQKNYEILDYKECVCKNIDVNID